MTGYIPFEEEWSCRRIFDETPYLLEFIELPGNWAGEEMPRLNESLKQADAVLCVYDVGDQKSFEQVKDIYEAVLASLGEDVRVPVGVVAAKSDTPTGKWQVEAEEGREFARRVGGAFAACSAKEGEGVEDAVEGPVTLAVEGKMLLSREREERYRERVKMYEERGRKSEDTATLVGRVGRRLPFGRR